MAKQKVNSKALEEKKKLFIYANELSQKINDKHYSQAIWNKYFIEYIKAVG